MVLRATATVVGPTADFRELWHHRKQLLAEHFGQSRDTGRCRNFLNSNHGLHDLDERRSISHAIGKLMISVYEQIADRNVQGCRPPQ
jgi:hypothetical protein